MQEKSCTAGGKVLSLSLAYKCSVFRNKVDFICTDSLRSSQESFRGGPVHCIAVYFTADAKGILKEESGI